MEADKAAEKGPVRQRLFDFDELAVGPEASRIKTQDMLLVLFADPNQSVVGNAAKDKSVFHNHDGLCLTRIVAESDKDVLRRIGDTLKSGNKVLALVDAEHCLPDQIEILKSVCATYKREVNVLLFRGDQKLLESRPSLASVIDGFSNCVEKTKTYSTSNPKLTFVLVRKDINGELRRLQG